MKAFGEFNPLKLCKCCAQPKLAIDFHTGRGGRPRGECKVCVSINAKARRAAADPSAETARKREWREQNPGRQADALRAWNMGPAAPKWRDVDACIAIYAESERQRKAGKHVQVDHYVPENGDIVCGLHVHQNLRIVPQRTNARKYNNLPPELEDWIV